MSLETLVSSRTPPISTSPTVRIVAFASFVVVLAIMPFGAMVIHLPSATGFMTQVLVYSIAAMSLNLILGYGGMIAFGHAAFFGIGGYVVGVLYQHAADGSLLYSLIPGTDSLLVALLSACIIGALASAAIGSLALRTSGVPFIMITLAFAQMLFFLFVSLQAYGGDDGLIMRRRDVLPFIDTRDDVTYYYVCLAAAAGWFAFIYFIVRSKFGAVLSGLRQNERRMIAIGIAPFRYRLVSFIIAGAGAAIAGALMANYLRFVSPDMMHWTKSGELMMMVILGGAGTMVGPIIGAATLILLETVLAAYTENWQFYLGLILLVIVIARPGGLAALLDRKGGK